MRIQGKKVYRYKNGELIAEYNSVYEASKQMGISRQRILQYCKGTRKNAEYELKKEE